MPTNARRNYSDSDRAIGESPQRDIDGRGRRGAGRSCSFMHEKLSKVQLPNEVGPQNADACLCCQLPTSHILRLGNESMLIDHVTIVISSPLLALVCMYQASVSQNLCSKTATPTAGLLSYLRDKLTWFAHHDSLEWLSPSPIRSPAVGVTCSCQKV